MFALQKLGSYAVAHWKGNQSLAWSFLVNGLLFYILMVAVGGAFAYLVARSGLANNRLILLYIGLFLAGIVWSLIGIAMSSVKALRDRDSGFPKKIFAVLLLAVVVTCLYLIEQDFGNLHIAQLSVGAPSSTAP